MYGASEISGYMDLIDVHTPVSLFTYAQTRISPVNCPDDQEKNAWAVPL